MASFRSLESQSTLKKYPRLIRSGLLIAFALGADQVAKHYQSDDQEQSAYDFFGLLKFVQAQDLETNSTEASLNAFKEFLDSKNEDELQWSQARSLEGTETQSEEDELSGDVRS